MMSSIKYFINNDENYPKLTALAIGLYPFLHYYSSNLYIIGSLKQFSFLIGLCFVLPQIIIQLSSLIFKLKPLQSLEKYRMSVANISLFVGLFGILIFHFNKKEILLALVVAGIIGLLFYKHFKKIVVLQYILALMSLVTFIPKLYFKITQNNKDWLETSEVILKAKLKVKPNIFVIQPDGYVNIDQINKEPYNFNNSEFESYLIKNNFINYPSFRSNYYSTLTSNSSLFAMKHHYYSNTNKNTLKTHNSSDVIVGNDNTVLKILKYNNYKSYLFTDNSFFLIDRPQLAYDYCNVPESMVSLHNSGIVKGVDIISDFKTVLDTLPKTNNFVFIEKTIPGHVIYRKGLSRGIEGERLRYLEKLEKANVWLEELITTINNYDDNALIIIIADHGGFVGLEHTLEAVNRRLNEVEAHSAFSSVLSIKYPKEIEYSKLDYKSNVNLFKTIFYSLTGEQLFLDSLESNASYIPLKENGNTEYYECIDVNGKVVYNKLSN